MSLASQTSGIHQQLREHFDRQIAEVIKGVQEGKPNERIADRILALAGEIEDYLEEKVSHQRSRGVEHHNQNLEGLSTALRDLATRYEEQHPAIESLARDLGHLRSEVHSESRLARPLYSLVIYVFAVSASMLAFGAGLLVPDDIVDIDVMSRDNSYVLSLDDADLEESCVEALRSSGLLADGVSVTLPAEENAESSQHTFIVSPFVLGGEQREEATILCFEQPGGAPLLLIREV